MLNFLVKNRQTGYAVYTRVGNDTESTYAYDHQRKCLQGILLIADGDGIMETQKLYAIDSGFQLAEDALNNFLQVTF